MLGGAVTVMKPWYMQSAKQVQTFFDVDPEKGLDEASIQTRLDKFGPNVDRLLTPSMRDIYKVKVRRHGQNRLIELQQIVPGDIVLLEAGNRVPADLRLMNVNHLYLDQSVLDGNGMPAAKNTFALDQEASLIEQKCMAYAGTFVAHGSGYGIVVAHADKTSINKILPKGHHKSKVSLKRSDRRLYRLGVTIQNSQASSLLKTVDVAFIDAEAPDADILEVIRKVQLSRGLPCKFLVSTATARRLTHEMIGTITYHGDQMAKHVPKQYLGMITDAQFIADADLSDVFKIVCTMQRHAAKVLWVSDGKQPTPAIQ